MNSYYKVISLFFVYAFYLFWFFYLGFWYGLLIFVVGSYTLKCMFYLFIQYISCPFLLKKNDNNNVIEDSKLNYNVGYVFATGLGSSPLQIMKYLSTYTDTRTQETYVNSNVTPLMQQNNNVYVTKGNEISLTGFFNPIITLGQFYLIVYYKMWMCGIRRESEFRATTSLMEYYVDPFNLKLGQDGDAEEVYTQFIKAAEKHDNIILFGFSKGCSSIIHSMSKIRDHKDYSKIKGIILEAPFNDLEELYYESPVIKKIFMVIMKYVFRYDYTTNKPINLLKTFKIDGNKTLPPLLVIGSEQDEVIPFNSCILKYQNALRGTDVFVTLKNSRHDMYYYDNEEDKSKYHNEIKYFNTIIKTLPSSIRNV